MSVSGNHLFEIFSFQTISGKVNPGDVLVSANDVPIAQLCYGVVDAADFLECTLNPMLRQRPLKLVWRKSNQSHQSNSSAVPEFADPHETEKKSPTFVRNAKTRQIKILRNLQSAKRRNLVKRRLKDNETKLRDNISRWKSNSKDDVNFE